jgi:acyl transferase domain-containing protein/acyl carrier protein
MSEKRSPLAIVGIGCRMPGGVTTPDELWQMISAGKDGICEVPADRWDWRRYFSEDPDAPGKIYVRNGGFLQQDIKQFDAEFFGISPREARSLDPQQRLLLETTCEAIDDAGLTLDRLAGSRTGVYVGALTLDNMLTQMSTRNRENIGPHCAASSTMTMLSNRLSYFLDLHGPSFSLDTACSSSLVAFHLACQGLWNNECDTALVGGVNVIFRPEFMVAMCKGQFLATDGRSKSFDQRANGYGRGEGAGVLVVKSWDKAIADRDRIYALVRATGCNQDGKTNGITVPNPEAQKNLIVSVLEQADIPAGGITYIEAHGTGTPVGDPIEARAIGEALGRHRRGGAALTIGSVKANIGHLEAASGIAGLIKLCMCYKYRAIPPVANLGEPNRAIPFDRLGLRLPTTLEPLPASDGPIFLAINSFGYGGTNAHAILEDPPAALASDTAARRELALLPVSARSGTALRAIAARYRDALLNDADGWREICAAAALRRTHHDFRAAFVGGSHDELIGQIDQWLSTTTSLAPRIKPADGKAVRPVFVFSGMGPQWWGMGQQLFEREPVFREFLIRADAEFCALSGWSILEEMRRTKETSRINQTIYAQPAIFVLQAGLLELLESWGVHPEAVIGHSLGENAAAYAAGVLSLEQAAQVGHHRSQILARAAGLGGGMLAVGLTETDADALIAPYAGRVTIAAINGPKAITLAGRTDALDEIAARLEVKGIFNRALQVEVAYHSFYMDSLQQPLVDALADLQPGLPKLDIYSTVTGAAVTGPAYDGPYWARNIRQSVQFIRALDAAVNDGRQLFLEVGAHPALTASIREYAALNKADLTVVPTLVRETDECRMLFKSLASLYTAGCDLDWATINGVPSQMRSLPAYPWQREMLWEETSSSLEERVGGPAAGLSGHRIDTHEPVWERQINNGYLPYIEDHVVQKLVMLPGAGFVDAALSLHREVGHAEGPMAVEDLQFRTPLILDRNGEATLRTVIDAGSGRIVFHARPHAGQSAWTRHADGRLSAKRLSPPASFDVDGLRARLGDARDVADFYARLASLGLEYGPAFRRITELRAQGNDVLARLTPVETSERYDIKHVLHPAVLDAAFQSLMAAIDADGEGGFVPASIEQVTVFAEAPDHAWSYGHVTQCGRDAVTGNLWLLDDQGRVFGSVTGLRCARVPRASHGPASVIERWLHQPAWHQAPLEASRRRDGSWLLLAEGGFSEHSFAARVAERLRYEGCHRVITVDMETDAHRLFEVHRVPSLAGIACITCDAPDADAGVAIARARRLLDLFKQLPANEPGLRAYLVTQRTQVVEAGDTADGFLQASAVGFFRVAHNEYPGLTCSTIDHDGGATAPANVVSELLADDAADDVAWRADLRYTQRIEERTLLDLERHDLARQARPRADGARCVLTRTQSGAAATGDPQRDVLYWKHEPACELPADAIEIEIAYWHIRADGVARRDRAHDLTRPTWREFSGRVSRVGSDVRSWQPGEPIAATALCSLASHVTVREQGLRAVRPGRMPLELAASLPITAASVNVALRQMARAERGESVLVVSGARDRIARMFAAPARGFGLHLLTACTGDIDPAAQADGATLDLCGDDFEQRLLAANQGRPVDIVVFCAPAHPGLHNRIPLAFGGRVVLLGPAVESIDPAHFIDPRTMYSLHRVDPTALAAANTRPYQTALVDLAAWAQHEGVPFPDQVCSADALPRQLLADLAGGATVVMSTLREVAPAVAGAAAIDPQAAYVITGGFGAFGMKVAGYLIAQGARHLVLVGRSGVTTDEATRRIAEWRGRGVKIREARIDITHYDAVDALFAEISAERDVRGIVHAAGVVRDARIADMTGDQLDAVMRPKVLGAWNLHRSSLRYRLPLDHFVLFSSAASLVGNRGQANYVAANAVLDSLSAYRRAGGLAAASINWGALAEVGMAANDDLLRQFRLMGINPFGADEAMVALHAVLRFQPTQVGIMDVDWVQWAKFEPKGGRSPRFAHLTDVRDDGVSQSIVDSLREMPAQERAAIVELMLAEQVAQTLRIPAERIDTKRPITDMGIDSLMAVELQIAINMVFGVELSALELTRGFSISQLTTPLMQRMGVAEPAAATRAVGNRADAPPNVDDLSEAELDALLEGVVAR